MADTSAFGCHIGGKQGEVAVKRNVVVVVAGLLLAQQQAAARPAPRGETRTAFRQAVEDYQMFVVPHCAPDEVRAYVAARVERDRAFVRSLRGTVLARDYARAVAERAEKDGHTVYHCFGPPPPPPPPPAPGATSAAPVPVQPEAPRYTLADHLTAGDRQFEKMLRLRDASLGRSRK